MLFHAALEGATPDNERWIRAKQRTAVRYEVPSLLVGLRARSAGRMIEDNAWFDQNEFAAHGGAFPIYVRGTGMVATVTVSGCRRRPTMSWWSRPCLTSSAAPGISRDAGRDGSPVPAGSLVCR